MAVSSASDIDARSPGKRRGRLLATYLLILGLGGVTVLLVLPRGNEIVAAPQGPPLLDVDGPATACLGARLAIAQSGIFVSVFDSDDGGLAGEHYGSKVAGGKIDRYTGEGDLAGTCATGTALAGRTMTWHAQFDRATIGPAAVHGIVDVGTEHLAMTATGADRIDASASHPLDGPELATRMLLAVAVIIVATRLFGSLASAVQQPKVVGEIVAGIVLGPSLLGLWFPGASSYLFPSQVASVLQVMAQFGLVFFMFMIGLELDRRSVRGSGHTAILVSHVSIVLPFSLGLLASLLLYPIVGSGRFASFALFMGAAMAITAFPVLARILTDTRLQRSPLGTLAIVCAAVDDVTAWCILAVVVAVVKSSGATDVLQTIVLTIAFVSFMLLCVRPLIRWLVRRSPDGSLSSRTVTTVIVFILLSCWTADKIGIHAIFGAFIAGVVMPRAPELFDEITGKLGDVTNLFLLPIFFAVVGLSTRITLLDRGELWLLTGFVICVAVFGKWFGSTLAARASGHDWRFSTALGVLMNARGLTEIVILTIGRNLNVISPALFTIMVIMALVTTLMTTPLLVRIYQPDRDA